MTDNNTVDEKLDEIRPSLGGIVREKLSDAMLPGFEVEFSPEEAEFAGAFQEDALTEADAKESTGDLTEDE